MRKFLSLLKNLWWVVQGSNLRPRPCEGGVSGNVYLLRTRGEAGFWRTQTPGGRHFVPPNFPPAILCVALVGCGGGSEPLSCLPLERVTVVLTGNSIAAGLGDDPTLRILLHARFGDAVTVVNRAIGGTELSDVVNGTAGFQAWPLGAGDVTIILDGTNEARRGTTPQVFAVYLERVARPGTVLVTPPPMDTTAPLSNGVDTLAYAQAVRSVAAEHGLVLADAYAYTVALPNWQALLPDGVHPSDLFYAQLSRDVIALAAVRAVAPLRCQ